jgi:serine/threonine-protein kinase
MVMELCEGSTLARLSDRCPPLEEGQVFAIVGQLAAALHHAHSAGVLHRDLKPGNVLLTWDGTLKLSDFGLARSFLSTGLTVHGEILGTPRYMPPEQLIGTSVDERADLYALGCIAYELFVGEPPFTEPDVAKLLAMQLNWSLDAALEAARTRKPAAFRDPSPDLRRLLEQTLATDRTKRTLNLEETARLARPIDVDLLWVAGLRR